jgi:hypothetical protein
MYNTNNMNSTITTDSNEIEHHTFTNVEFSGVVVKWESRSLEGKIQTYMSDYHLFIKYGDKVYVDVYYIGEIVISFDELQKNRYLKHYYDLSLMLTNNKHIVFQKSKYKNVEPFIYREDRFWGFDSAFIDANHKKIDKIVEHLYKVVNNEQPYYYKINPYDLENMEYTSQEVLTNFHKNNAERKCDKFWGGNFEHTYDIYNNLVIDYNNNKNIIEKET